jgi:hypothetical protein
MARQWWPRVNLPDAQVGGLATNREFARIGTRAGTYASDLGGLDVRQLNLQCTRKSGDDVVLHLQEIGAIVVERLGPEMSAALGVDQLSVDANLSAGRLHRSFRRVAHAEIAADLLHVGRLPLVSEGGIARDHETAGNARQISGQLVSQHVGEIVLSGIAGEIGEWQHHDRETRGRGGRGPFRDEDIPAASGDHNERCDHHPEDGNQRRTLRGRRRGLRRLRLAGNAHLKRIGPDRLGNVLESRRAEISDFEVEPLLDLTVGVLGKTDCARFGDSLEPRGDIEPVAHKVAVALLNNVAQVNADAKVNALFGRQTRVALDHAGLHFDGAAHRIDDAAELDDEPSPVRLTTRP